MPINGAVDFLSDREIRGWIDIDDNSSFDIAAHIDGDQVNCTLGTIRADGGPGKTRRAFSVISPRPISATELADGTVYVACRKDATWTPLPVWHAIKTAAAIDSVPLTGLQPGLAFAGEPIRTAIEHAVTSVPAWRPLSGKKLAAIVTYAHDSSAWFPYFYRYYANIFGSDRIHIVTPNPQSFSGYELGGLIGLPGFPYDDDALARFMSNMCAGLLAYYKWVAVLDVDEIVIPHPASGKGLIELLENTTADTLVSRGYDVIQDQDEPPFDLTNDVLAQRSWGVPNSAMCKPHFVSTPVRWSAGFHYTNYKPRFPDQENATITLHLKYACAHVRERLLATVQTVDYERAFIADYALNSVRRESHPLFIAHTDPARIFDDVEGVFSRFAEKFLSRVRFDRHRGVWHGAHVQESHLVNLRHYSIPRF